MTGVVERQSARVILLDAADRVLLLRWVHPSRDDGVWWITPGGGLEPDEDYPAGAVRELHEEIGLRLTTADLTGPVFERDAESVIETGLVRQHEVYFTARVDSHDVVTEGWTPFEVATITETRWWTREELATTTERIAPKNLIELLPC
jgi:8-oxo-dGTP pyrophosphatase MutT (NUDIX family)